MNGAEFLVKALEAHGVTHVFGIPGAKVDSVFTALLDSPIELVLCRHEQNAAFMAQAFGRLTGRIGVCLATSGPGVPTWSLDWPPPLPRAIPCWRSEVRCP